MGITSDSKKIGAVGIYLSFPASHSLMQLRSCMGLRKSTLKLIRLPKRAQLSRKGNPRDYKKVIMGCQQKGIVENGKELGSLVISNGN